MTRVYSRADGSVWLGPSFATDLIQDVEEDPTPSPHASPFLPPPPPTQKSFFVPETPPRMPISTPPPPQPKKRLGLSEVLASNITAGQYRRYLDGKIKNMIKGDFITFEPAGNRGHFRIGKVTDLTHIGFDTKSVSFFFTPYTVRY